jgi:hypothetical protein
MIKNEFEDFKNAESVTPPQGVSDQILARVQNNLNPSAWRVFAKLAGIHVVTALVTLSICPQFGIRVFGSGTGLMGYFMSLGKYGCMVACGCFFLGSSVLVAIALMRPEEIRVIRSRRLFELGALTLLSLGFFIMLQAQVVLGIFVAWTFGSLLGGILVLEAGWNLRLRLAKTTA